jgi:hypothetical protein
LLLKEKSKRIFPAIGAMAVDFKIHYSLINIQAFLALIFAPLRLCSPNINQATHACPMSYKQSKKKVAIFLEKSKIHVYLCPPRERDVLIKY